MSLGIVLFWTVPFSHSAALVQNLQTPPQQVGSEPFGTAVMREHRLVEAWGPHCRFPDFQRAGAKGGGVYMGYPGP